MKLRATFSDGTVDVYNGSRPVTVGWQLTNPEGHKFSGHSLDERKARKTAEGYARFNAPFGYVERPPHRATAAGYAYLHKLALSHGFKNYDAMYRDYANKLAVRKAQCKIEIVPVET